MLLGVLGEAAAVFSGPTSGEFRMPGTESQRAMEALEKQLPQAAVVPT